MGLSDLVVYDSVMKSNIPTQEKSAIGKWFERVSNIIPARDEEKSSGLSKEHVVNAVQAFRQSLESNVVSFGLGAFHAEVGLDVAKVPVDMVSGALLTVGSIAMAKSEISRDLLNMGVACQNSYTFRKGHAWAAARKERQGDVPATKMGQVNIAGEGDSEDPIVQVAKTIEQD